MNQCKRCGYEWISIKENPKCCPQCKNYRWETSKIEEKVEGEYS